MTKIISKEEVKKATESEKCEMILAIIRRTGSICRTY